MARVQVTGTPAVVVATVFFLIVCGAGALGIWWSQARLALGREAPSFVPVDATVLSTDYTAQGGRRGSARTYRPRVRYEYVVEGQRHESQEYGPSPPGFPTRQGLEEALASAGITPGATIQVFHDPNRPERAVISRDVRPGSLDWMWLVTGAGGLFGAVGAWCLVALATSPSFRRTIRGGR